MSSWEGAKTLKDIAEAYQSVYEKKAYEASKDQDQDGDNDFADVVIARMIASGVPKEKAIAMVKDKSYNKKEVEIVDEATAMAKRGHDETAIRNKIAKSTGGGEAADRATELENRPTFGQRGVDTEARKKYAIAQRGVFRDTTSSNPGLHVGQHTSDDPAVKELQAARGAQRGVLTPREKRKFNREAYEAYEFVASYLLENNFASTVEDANVIINNMSEGWFNQIMEGASASLADLAAKFARRRNQNQTPETKEMLKRLASLARVRATGPLEPPDSRSGLTQSDRDARRYDDASHDWDEVPGKHGIHRHGSGTITKNPRKLAHQIARGQHAER